MSRGAARLNDICTGHCETKTIISPNPDIPPRVIVCCYPPRPSIEGSLDTFCNGRNLHCVTHKWASHCGPVILDEDGQPVQSCGCHAGELSTGSSTVICNNLRVGRCGDEISCNSTVATCSSDVIIGD